MPALLRSSPSAGSEFGALRCRLSRAEAVDESRYRCGGVSDLRGAWQPSRLPPRVYPLAGQVATATRVLVGARKGEGGGRRPQPQERTCVGRNDENNGMTASMRRFLAWDASVTSSPGDSSMMLSSDPSPAAPEAPECAR